MTIYAKDLTNRSIIHQKLLAQLDHYRTQYNTSFHFNPEDEHLAKTNLILLNDNSFLSNIEDNFLMVGKLLRLEELGDILSICDGVGIVECSHGVLTDAEVGFKPHVSAIRTLPNFTSNMLHSAGYTNKVINLAVHRAYEVRHGAGPIPTYDPGFTARMIPNPISSTNRWQGFIRAGAIDFNLIQHALKISNNTKFDGICLTCFDQVLKDNRLWGTCSRYDSHNSLNSVNLSDVKPIIDHIKIKNLISRSELFNLVDDTLQSNLNLHLSILSIGPTEKQKIYRTTYLNN